MDAPRHTAVLLCDTHEHLAAAAEAHARRRFDVVGVWRHGRADRTIDPGAAAALAAGVDFLLNFLSPVVLRAEHLRPVRRLAINFHPAPPKWPGVGSASFALYEGDAAFGATAHVLTEAVDAGPILRTASFPIAPGDDCAAVFDKGLAHALLLFFDVADELARTGGMAPSGERWARPAVTRRQFERWMTLSPNDPPEEVARKVKACRHPRFPGPFVELHGVRFAVPAGAALPAVLPIIPQPRAA